MAKNRVKNAEADGPVVQVHKLAGFWPRLVGLIGRELPAPGCAVWLTPCRQVHTFWMRSAIDVVSLDPSGAVVAVQMLAPWRIGHYVVSATSVLELLPGEATRLGLAVGVRPRLIVVPA